MISSENGLRIDAIDAALDEAYEFVSKSCPGCGEPEATPESHSEICAHLDDAMWELGQLKRDVIRLEEVERAYYQEVSYHAKRGLI